MCVSSRSEAVPSDQAKGKAASFAVQADERGRELEAVRAYLVLVAQRGGAPDVAVKRAAADLARIALLAAAHNPAALRSHGAVRHEREVALRAALCVLPEEHRQVIEWHHKERLPFDAIAGRLGTSPDAARKIWGRALLRLRATLGAGHEHW